MPRLPFFTVDAFTRKLFCGNGAAVVLLKEPLPDNICQSIAAELKLSDTAFLRPLSDKALAEEDNFELRWFSPTHEVPLCGHATLATAHVLFYELSNINDQISFETKFSGRLQCSKSEKNSILMNFPQYNDVQQITLDDKTAPSCLEALISHVVGDLPVGSVHMSPKSKILIIMLAENCTRAQLESLSPNGDTLMQIYPEGEFLRGICVTLAGSTQKGCTDETESVYDFVSRYFAPWWGVPEDPATGSLHCALGPLWQRYYWGKSNFYAFQCFPGRGAEFSLVLKPEDSRIDIVGSCVTVIQGELNV